MRSTRRGSSFVVLGALGLAASSALAQSEVPLAVTALTQEQLQQRVVDLEERLSVMEASKVAPPDATASASSSVMKAAEAQSLPSPSGYKNGKFVLSSDDGNFTLQPYLQFQLRWAGNYADLDGDSSWNSGFEIKRLRIGAQGNAFNKNLTYRFQWATSVNNGQVTLEDAWLNYKIDDQWSVFGGQFKDPLGHEENVSPFMQLAAERSLVNALLSGGLADYVQGVGASWKQGPWETWMAVHDGQNSDNTNFQDGATQWGLAARAEHLVKGDKKNYSDFTARGTKSELLVVGAGADISGRADDNRLLYVADVQWENTKGLGLFGSFNGASTMGFGDNDDDTDWGFLVQAGQMLHTDSKWEVFGRFGYVHYESADEDLTEITGGVNRYFYGHNLKATADVVFLPNGAPAGVTGLNYVDSIPDSQVVFRVQLQMML